MYKIFVFLIIFLIQYVHASEIGNETGLEIPRFVSLKSDDSNLRVGPSINYPIIINYNVKNYPIMVVDEYDEWRKIIDFRENTGWLHKSLIKGERFGLIVIEQNKSVNIFNTIYGKIIGEIGNNNVVKIEKCKINWCLIKKNEHAGWISKNNLWGVKQKETFNISFFQLFIDFFWKSLNTVNNLIG